MQRARRRDCDCAARRSALGSLEDALHLASLLCRDIGQIVEAGIPELIDVQRRLPGRKRLKRAVGELDNDALLLEALQGVVHVEVYVDAESILEILLDRLVHLAQVANVHAAS